MTGKYNSGDVVYIVENGHFIRECVVIRYSGGLYMIRFTDSNGAIKLRESRLFLQKRKQKRVFVDMTRNKVYVIDYVDTSINIKIWKK